jgi:hypothetical protein
MSLAEKTIAEKKLKELIRAYQARAAEPEQKVAGTR